MIAAFDPNPIKKLPIPIIGMFIEINKMIHPVTVITQEINYAVFLPLLSATNGIIMYPIKDPR